MCRIIRIYSPSRPDIGSYYSFVCRTPDVYLQLEKKAYRQASRSPDMYYQTIAYPIIAVGDAKIEVIIEIPDDSYENIYESFQDPPDTIHRPADIITAVSPMHNLIEPYRMCECGSYISVKYMSRHVKTAIHNQRIEEMGLLTPDEHATMVEHNNRSKESRRQFNVMLDSGANDSGADDSQPDIIPQMCLCGELIYNIDSHYRTKKHKNWVANRRFQLESEACSLAGSSGRVNT